MGQFKRFEYIPVWKIGRQLVKDVYAATRSAVSFLDGSPVCKPPALNKVRSIIKNQVREIKK